MPTINWPRVLVGGLAAGLIVNLSEFIISGVWLRAEWEKVLLALNRPLVASGGQMAALLFWGFLLGLTSIALYAHIRDRYGPGWRTAWIAGLAVWCVGYLSGTVAGVSMGIFPLSLATDATLAGLIEILAASTAGAWLYRPLTK